MIVPAYALHVRCTEGQTLSVETAASARIIRDGAGSYLLLTARMEPNAVQLDLDDDGEFWFVCQCGAFPAPLALTTHHDQRRAHALADRLDAQE